MTIKVMEVVWSSFYSSLTLLFWARTKYDTHEATPHDVIHAVSLTPHFAN